MEEYLNNQYIVSHLSSDNNYNLVLIPIIIIMEITLFICLFKNNCNNYNLKNK